ncbi:hypothetical protein ACFY0B_35705 [Streptomyces sp. NPDC001797]|uniref:hypothetical protein n=1 Tax=Streptomyces sp. NPDC001797 TaxID=3364610 RepID=UPI0036C6AB44
MNEDPRVARNVAVDHRRRDRYVPVGVIAAATAAYRRGIAADFAGTALVPVRDHAGAVADRSVLVGALPALAPAYREAVVLVHVMGRAGPRTSPHRWAFRAGRSSPYPSRCPCGAGGVGALRHPRRGGLSVRSHGGMPRWQLAGATAAPRGAVETCRRCDTRGQ